MESRVDIVVAAYGALPVAVRRRWELAEVSAERLERDFDNEPRERREILIAALAHRLGMRRSWGRAAVAHARPLWEVLRLDNFVKLDARGLELLWLVACTSRDVRHTLHPKAALAAVALWRHGDRAQRARAEQLLTERGLPVREQFAYDLVRTLGRNAMELEVAEDRGLFALAKLHLDAKIWGMAALLGGLHLVARYDPWYTGDPSSNLEKACDRAALQRPHENAPWLLLMADAAIAGRLTWSWLERPVQAAIRLTVGHPDHRAQLTAFHAQRLYNATPARLQQLYAPLLDVLAAGQFPAGKSALRHLEREVELTAANNPFRAMRLMELATARAAGRPIQQVLLNAQSLDRLTERLLTLYVRTWHVDPIAARFVRAHASDVHWELFDDVRATDVETYQLVADYEATFGAREATLLGVPIAHVDKDAAARVRYFQSSRTNPNSVARALRTLELPEKLPVTHLGGARWLSQLTAELMLQFQVRAEQLDLREEVLRELARVGAPVNSWADIGALPITKIEAALARGRQRDLLVAAATGGAAGILAPSTTGLSAIMDVPLLMSLIADTCARHCWYYGFDPREVPELPVVILAVALGGVEAQFDDPDDVRHRLQRYLVRRSILLAALGQGVMSQLAGPTVGVLLDRFAPARKSIGFSSALGRLGVRNRQSERPLARTMRRAVLPAIDGVFGAAFNVSLIYDLCESAQAVLADRFFARKYAEWEPRF